MDCMRQLFCYLNLFYFFSATSSAQEYFPIRVNQQWGLIDKTGRIAVEPTYDAIGEFYKYGYAVVQKNGNVGIVNDKGQTILPAKYADLQILDSTIFAVVLQNSWKVIDINQKIILDDHYEKVKIWKKKFISFSRKGKWGLVDLSGKTIIQPIYDDIKSYENDYFLVENESYKGLLEENGKVIIAPIANDIIINSDSLFFYRRHYKWGAVNGKGESLLNSEWDTFELIGEQFIKLTETSKAVLYSRPLNKIVSYKVYDDYYFLSQNSILVKLNQQMGAINAKGEIVLTCQYDEIKPFGKHHFRVRKGEKWGVMDEAESEVLGFKYSYISPLKEEVCIIREDKLLGVANFKGEIMVSPAYSKIELKDNQARAFKGDNLTLFAFDKQGQLLQDAAIGTFKGTIKIKKKAKKELTGLANIDCNEAEEDYILENFEWFYSPIEDRWGLRQLATGEIVIKPMFDEILIKRALGFTLVSIHRFEKQVFDRTTFRCEELYGMVNNKEGKLVTELFFWDIRMEDFEEKNLEVARCVFKDGKHGLVKRNGKVIKKDYAYIGEFKNGIARASSRGELSGTTTYTDSNLGKITDYLSTLKTPSEMVDYTIHDQEFLKNALLICQNCDWGFIDTSGTSVVPEIYNFAQDFVNNIAIVKKEDKWGFINDTNKVLLDFRYDDIQFLHNTNQKILRLYTNHDKHGLIDTLGKAVIPVIYDDIGRANEGVVPVKKNGLWGFANLQGKLVIPCQYEEAHGFFGGLAAVRKNRKWGFINPFNNVIIPFKYKAVGDFSDELAWFKETYKHGYMNALGETIIEAQFDEAKDFESGIARVQLGIEWGLIDKKGEFVLPPKFVYISNFDAVNLAVVKLSNSKYSFINRKGERVSGKRFRQVVAFNEGLAAVQSDDVWGFMDSLGHLAIAPKFSRVSSFCCGRAAAKLDNKWGFIDYAGNWVVEPQFTKCLNYKDGKAIVYNGYQNAGLIDLDGNFIIEPNVYRMIDFTDGRGLVRDGNYRFYYITEENRVYKGYYQHAEGFQDGVAAVKQQGKWGLINDKGIELIPPKYDRVEPFDNGFAKVRISQFSGIVNLKGEVIADANYEYITYAGNGLFRVEEGDKIGYFDSAGQWVWALQR